MEKKKSLVTLSIALLVVAFALQVYELAQSSFLNGLVVAIVNAVAVIAGLGYVLMDYKKQAARGRDI